MTAFDMWWESYVKIKNLDTNPETMNLLNLMKKAAKDAFFAGAEIGVGFMLK